MPFFWKAVRKRPARSAPRHARPRLEQLESRLVMYSATGNFWPSQQLVTISFMPDGTLMGSGTNGNTYSDMFAKFNARWSTATWETEILKAAQVWAQAANINFTVVADNGTPSGQGDYQQGDPGMGDIRFGTATLGANYLGMASLPPPVNNYSGAGDIVFNDAQSYSINTAYDLQSVAMHEIGHALGMDHSTTYGTVMYPSYNGTKRALTSDDLAGIKSVYGARQGDALEGLLGNNTFQTASTITSLIDPVAMTGQVNNVDISSTADKDYYLITAPLGSTQLTVNVQSSGLSLLRPDLAVYSPGLLGLQPTLLSETVGTGYLGSTLSLTINNVTPGQSYYVKVAGADSTAFGTGAYSLSVSTGSSAPPTVTPPNTQLLDGAAFSAGGGLAELADQGDQNAAQNGVDFYSIVDDLAPPNPPPGKGGGGSVAIDQFLADPRQEVIVGAKGNAATPGQSQEWFNQFLSTPERLQGDGAGGHGTTPQPTHALDQIFEDGTSFLAGATQAGAARASAEAAAAITAHSHGADASSGDDQDAVFELFSGQPDYFRL